MIKWFDREFDFANNQNDLATLRARLIAFPAKLEAQVMSIPEPVLLLADPGKWSIKEHIGHLADLEPLWLGRLEDILDGKTELRVTDLENTKTHQGGHNNTSLGELLLHFNQLRRQTIIAMDLITPHDLPKFALHPRLKTPMRVTDHLLFIAEHDEHHLASIVELISAYAGSD